MPITTTVESPRPRRREKPEREGTKSVSVRIRQEAALPKIIVTGHAKQGDRKLVAQGVKPELLERLAKNINAPFYFQIELAILKTCEMLEARNTVEIFKAEDLE